MVFFRRKFLRLIDDERHMKRFTLKLASWFGMIAIVFAQLAVSAYACPSQAPGSADAASAMQVPEDTRPCADFATPGLCQQHCAYGQQNVGDEPAPLNFVALVPAFVVYLKQQPLVAQLAPAAGPSLQHAFGPPLSIRNCCFRI